MEEYLTHWWNGDLAAHYQPFGLQVSQLNKLFKIGQYLFGLLALFELLQFSTVMARLKLVTYLSIFTIRFPSVLLNTLNLLPRLALGLIAVLTGGMAVRDVLALLTSSRNWGMPQPVEVEGQAEQQRLALLRE